MPSSWSPSLRFELQFTGENINLWGEKLNATLARADYAIAGWLTKPLTGDVALTTANGGDDEARAAMIKFTGGAGPFTVTIPAVSKSYVVWNACGGPVTVTAGAGAAVAVIPGEIVPLVCDGAGVRRAAAQSYGGSRIRDVGAPLDDHDAATRKFVVDTAWAHNTGVLPGQPGNAGKYLKTDGANAAWQPVTTSDLSDYETGVKGLAVALALAL